MYTEQFLYINPKLEIRMKLVATLIASLFAVSAFAAEPAKKETAPAAKPAASTPAPAAKVDATKSPASAPAKAADKKAEAPKK